MWFDLSKSFRANQCTLLFEQLYIKKFYTKEWAFNRSIIRRVHLLIQTISIMSVFNYKHSRYLTRTLITVRLNNLIYHTWRKHKSAWTIPDVTRTVFFRWKTETRTLWSNYKIISLCVVTSARTVCFSGA